MGVSGAMQARRAFVKVMIGLAALYGVLLNVTRDSPDNVVTQAHKKLVRKVHPDKGGSKEHAQQLQEARDAWQTAKDNPGRRGRSKREDKPPRSKVNSDNCSLEVADPEQVRTAFRIRSRGVLLTYHGVKDLAQWHRFVIHFETNARKLGIKYWCATLEKTQSGNLHIHLMLQFATDRERETKTFYFEGLKPRADPNDLLGEGWGKRRVQDSYDRGFFYCWADKLGTLRDESDKPCVAGNYEPVWESAAKCRYKVRGKWAESLWQARKLSHETYEEYLFKTRDGVLARKRTLDACRDREELDGERCEMEAVVKRIKSNTSLYRPFPVVAEAGQWLEHFKHDALRYPLLVVRGNSHTGKTEWIKSLFRNALELKIGTLEHFPSKMRSFKRGVHDALILDDVRDLAFLVAHQEKLQGKYDALVEFASTPGGVCSFTKWLFKVPVAVTCNYSTKNLAYLTDNDFLGNVANRVVVDFPPASFQPGA